MSQIIVTLADDGIRYYVATRDGRPLWSKGKSTAPTFSGPLLETILRQLRALEPNRKIIPMSPLGKIDAARFGKEFAGQSA